MHEQFRTCQGVTLWLVSVLVSNGGFKRVSFSFKTMTHQQICLVGMVFIGKREIVHKMKPTITMKPPSRSICFILMHSQWSLCDISEELFATARLYHYYTKYFAKCFEIGLRGWQDFKPPRLMPTINWGVHFLLAEAVTVNRLAKSIYRGPLGKIRPFQRQAS